MRTQVRLLLAAMMFLEYAVWGAWLPVLGATLWARHIQPVDIGKVYGALWLGCIITPFLGGQLVDRRVPSQVFLGVSHLLAAVAAFFMAQQTTPRGLIGGMLIWALLFAPSLSITNSIAFYHIDRIDSDEASREREFSIIRTAGTIGWIAAAFLLFGFMRVTHSNGVEGPLPEMQLAGILGILMGLFAFLLPNTPPATGVRTDPLAFRKAFSLFRGVPGFAIFMLISFVAATEFQFFYVLSAPYLNQVWNIPLDSVAINKSISQVAEVIALAVLLPLWLPSKGMRWCLLLGSFAWPLRYFVFAAGHHLPREIVIASLGLHGFGYAFVMVVQQLYIDRVAPKDIRASAQSLLTFATLGVGSLLGSLFCGIVQQHYTNAQGTTNWLPVFMLPAIVTLVCALAYMATFRNPQESAVVSELDYPPVRA